MRACICVCVATMIGLQAIIACSPSVDSGPVSERWRKQKAQVIVPSDRNGVIDKSELRNLLEAVSSSGEASTAQG